MRHIRIISRASGKAYGIGIGHYLLVIGQILGIIALMFADKEMTEDTSESR